jgi:hypothetical protein
MSFRLLVALLAMTVNAHAADAPAPPDAAMPDASMREVAERVARFIATLDDAALDGTFAERDVTIIENFAPYRFDGVDAVANWAAGMRAHRTDTTDLQWTFGPAQDFSRSGERVFFALPTTWTGKFRGTPFTETGGWAFVLVQRTGADGRSAWRVQSYGWAVTGITTP